jgi:glycosyltransferase involved in cell wall biosynthesis
MQPQIDLLCLGHTPPVTWSPGNVWTAAPTPQAVHALLQQHLPRSHADAWLWWDATLGSPDPERVRHALSRPGDLWHAGLCLGMAGLPGLLHFARPTWMLNRDPDPAIEVTSWRLSLRACLVRTEVLRQMGGVIPTFETLAGAALELGYRSVRRGVLTRHLPWLVPEGLSPTIPVLPLEDEVRLLSYHLGRNWCLWALLRAVWTGAVPLTAALRAWHLVSRTARPSLPAPYRHKMGQITQIEPSPRVSVLIPTLERYPYLHTLLAQLRRQTIPPLEIIVVDQTPIEYRDNTLVEEFADLPLRVFYQDQPGQCSSRNRGIQATQGDHILFLDDDVEVQDNFIAQHLHNLQCFRADVSSGGINEIGAGPVPKAFTFTRMSDVFPLGNTLLPRDLLSTSGLLDLAYERGQRADADLGMRVYLSGALILFNPETSVLHHHAPRGGLRAHKARVITYASSRRHLLQRHLPSVSEIYLALRYFTPQQVREVLWLRLLGTFSIRGNSGRKAVKIIISLARLPDSFLIIRQRYNQAVQMLADFPQIPAVNRQNVHRSDLISHQ